MNNEHVKKEEIVSIDAKKKIIFITKKPIILATGEEKIINEIDNKMDLYNLFDEADLAIRNENDRIRLSDFEIVDITNWEYKSYDDLCFQMMNYGPLGKTK